MAMRSTSALYVAPLCPAVACPTPALRAFVVRKAKSVAFRPLCGPLLTPHEGGDQPAARLSPITNVAEGAARAKLPISPLVGEMSGRTEGGAKELHIAGEWS